MTNHTILLMAQGLNTRWLAGNPDSHGLPSSKHLIPINGVPNLLRTFQMLSGLATVVGWPEYAELVGPENIFALAEPGMLAGGMLQTRALWGTRRTTFLLGDVVWSSSLLDTAIWRRGPWHMVIREGMNPSGRISSERYSLSITSELYDQLEGFLAATSDTGRLLDIRQWLTDQFMPAQSIRVSRMDDSFPLIECPDWTDDVDTVDEWLRFGPTIQAQASLDSGALLL